MTMPVEQIDVQCPSCGHSYRSFYRGSMNLEMDDFDAEYIESMSTATCPECRHRVSLEVLVVERNGDWNMGPFNSTDKLTKAKARTSERKPQVRRVALVSCVKQKQKTAAPARDLYVSTLFCRYRKYAEINADEWFILSAEHGVIPPNRRIKPYDRTLNKMSKQERLAWATRVQKQLRDLLHPETEVILLAGARYREGVRGFLLENGFSIKVPFGGLKFGQLLKRLKEEVG